MVGKAGCVGSFPIGCEFASFDSGTPEGIQITVKLLLSSQPMTVLPLSIYKLWM